METTKMIKVKNRSMGSVGYNLPDAHIQRSFMPGETKTVPVSEIIALSYQPGGYVLMSKYLRFFDAEELTEELNIPTEPEYYYNEQDVVDLLKTGSLDALLDALDFAPEGVIELIKKYAVELPIADMTKMDAIKEKTGYDVYNVIRHNKEAQDALGAPVTTPANKRRTSGIKEEPKKEEAPEKPARRTEAKKYKVVNK